MLSGAKWWNVVGAVVAVIGLFITVKTVFFSDPGPVALRDTAYPEITNSSECEAEWSFVEYQICEDKNSRIPVMITSSEICGVIKKSEPQKIHEFNRCAHPSHGTQGYRQKEIFEKWSAWRGGGSNPLAWCNDMRNFAESSIGQPFVWQVLQTKEESKKDWLGHVSYKCFCQAEAHWDPLYANARSVACGEAQPVNVDVDSPRTCEDPNSIARYPETRRKECSESFERRFIDAKQLDDLIQRIENGEIASAKCTTCDALAELPRDKAECLIASAQQHMLRGDEDGIKMIKRMLVGLLNNPPEGLTDHELDRMEAQLWYLDRAL